MPGNEDRDLVGSALTFVRRAMFLVAVALLAWASRAAYDSLSSGDRASEAGSVLASLLPVLVAVFAGAHLLAASLKAGPGASGGHAKRGARAGGVA